MLSDDKSGSGMEFTRVPMRKLPGVRASKSFGNLCLNVELYRFEHISDAVSQFSLMNSWYVKNDTLPLRAYSLIIRDSTVRKTKLAH
jgi:hypothetical protein